MYTSTRWRRFILQNERPESVGSSIVSTRRRDAALAASDYEDYDARVNKELLPEYRPDCVRVLICDHSLCGRM